MLLSLADPRFSLDLKQITISFFRKNIQVYLLEFLFELSPDFLTIFANQLS